MSTVIPWSIPEIGEEELAEIHDVFQTSWLSSGPKVQLFEKRMGALLGSPHAIAVSNGSDALELTLQSYGIGRGDEVIVPAMTYYATAAAVARVGATPVFSDVEDRTFNLDPARLADAMSERTRAALFIDAGGIPADIDNLRLEAERLGIVLIQDAAQSLGGSYRGAPLGVQTETSTMSFHMAKVMTTVEGGMIFTTDATRAEQLRSYRNQGETSKYVHAVLGTNCRMTDLAAGIGLAQLGKLEHFLDRRRQVAGMYNERLEGVSSVRVVRSDPPSANANFLLTVLIENRDEVACALRTHGIDYRICYGSPVFEQPVFAERRAPCRVTPSPVAGWFAARTLSLPMAPSLTPQQVAAVCDVVARTSRGYISNP